MSYYAHTHNNCKDNDYIRKKQKKKKKVRTVFDKPPLPHTKIKRLKN